MKLLDLSTPFDKDYSIPSYPFGHFDLEIKHTTTIPRDGNYSTQITMYSHVGTHMDAPMHVLSRKEKNGKYYLGDYPLEQMYGETVVLDIPKGVEEPYGAAIRAEDLEKASKASNELGVREGDIVLVHTGWGRYFTEDPKTAHWIFYKGPGLDIDGAEWLVKKKIKAFGMDTIGTQYKKYSFFPSKEELDIGIKHVGEPVHRILLSNDILLIEHLYHLDQIAGKRVICGFFPLPFVDIEASPIRAIAFLDD